MDREYVIQHDIVGRYVRGQLSEEEAAAFEAHCLWCGESLDELELTERMRQGFKDLARNETIRPSAGFLQFLNSPRYAAAASILLVASLATSGLLYREIATSQRAGFASGQVFSLEAHRGSAGSSTNRVVVGDPETVVVLIIYPDAVAGGTYRVKLYRDGGNEPVWQHSIKQENAEALAVMPPGAVLRPGNYRVRVEDATSAAGTAVVADVEFTAVTQDAVR